MATITFLGTGNYLAEGRYWNSFVIDGTILVEPSPIALPHLRKTGVDVAAIDAVFISHFHPDHTFGWPFLLLEVLLKHAGRPLHVVGPPGVEAYLLEMMRLGAVTNVHNEAHAHVDITYVEVDGDWQESGGVRFRAVEVDHVPDLRCYGYLIERDGVTVGYSGDTHPCAGLDELVTASDVLVVECNGKHPHRSHMDVAEVRTLRERFPDTPFVLTHMGGDVEDEGLANTRIPQDFETIEV